MRVLYGALASGALTIHARMLLFYFTLVFASAIDHTSYTCQVHEVEERNNQHINDLLQNHSKAFEQMKAYYNSITRGNLELIKNLQKTVSTLKEGAETNKVRLGECIVQNQKLSEPLELVTREIAHFQGLLRERTKDQMALRNAKSRLAAINKSSKTLTLQHTQLEEVPN